MHRDSIVELVGPAGAGKTTLFNALANKVPSIRRENPPVIWAPSYYPTIIKNTGRLVPLLLHLSPKKFSELSRYDIALLILLTGWQELLLKKSKTTNDILLLDQGPVFMMAFLSIYGPINQQNTHHSTWWTNIIHQWAKTISVIVYLDASIDILLERNRRRQDHTIEHINGKTDLEARNFLGCYQDTYRQLISDFSLNNNHLRIVSINTEEYSVEYQVDLVLHEIKK